MTVRTSVRRGGLALAIAAASCGRGDERAGVVDMSIEDPAAHWAEFVRMEPPVHLPSSARAVAQVEVWLRLPATGEIRTTTGEDGAARLLFPEGTVADRIEYAGQGDARRIVDVRGATIDAENGCRWHTLRPIDGSVGSPLAGVQWPCDDAEAQRAATAAMLDVLREQLQAAHVPRNAAERELAAFAQKNDCGGCHTRARPAAAHPGEFGIVHRGTDASGFFVPQTVLADAIPLESYGAFDPNVDDPAIAIECAAHAVDTAAARARCIDGSVPSGRLDWNRAAEDDPARVKRICSARRTLVERLDAASRESFAAALRPCDQ